MDRSPPPFFRQGPSANARLLFFSLLAIGLLVADARLDALERLRQGIGTVLYPVQRVLLVPRDTARTASEYLSDVGRLRAENAELRRIETANAKALLQAEQFASENSQLRQLLGVRDRTAVRSTVAEVLYASRDPFSRKVVIDKGLQQGVAAGQPVIDTSGVVGQVTRVFPLSSEVTLLTDRYATLPVEITRSGLRSVAFGAGRDGGIELRYLPTSADVREGDTVVTSGLDSLYPPGIPVGKVTGVDRSSSAFVRARLEPLGGVERARLLLVLMPEAQPVPPPPPEPEPDVRKRARKG